MTIQRAHEGGYEVKDVCPVCGAIGDTVRHRTFECPSTAHAVAQAVPQWLIREGRRASNDSLFWNTGVFPHPADVASMPSNGGELLAEVCIDGCWQIADEWKGWHEGWDRGFEGFLYGDVSCDTRHVPELKRAACSVFQTSSEASR